MEGKDRHIEELIEDYLLGKLGPEEMLSFEQRLATDENLRKEVDFQRLLMESVQIARRKELKAYIAANTVERKRSLTPLWLSAAAVLLLLAGAVFLFRPHEQKQVSFSLPAPNSPVASSADSVFQPPVNGNSQPLAKLEEKRRPQLKTESSKPELSREEPLMSAPQEELNTVDDHKVLADSSTKNEVVEMKDGVLADKSYITLQNTTVNASSPGTFTPKSPSLKEVSIEKLATDEKLKDTVLQVAWMPVNQQEFDLHQRDETQKKQKSERTMQYATNKALDTVVGDAPPTGPSSVQVEYWKSASRFKGYKYFDGRLQLYGVKEKELLRLVYWNRNLYLIRNKSLYKLVELNEFNKFNALDNPELLHRFGL